MGNKKKSDRILKKIKKKDESKNPLLDKKMGAPKSEEKDLTEDQKEFGRLLGLGMNEKEIQDRLKFSDYQVREYKKLPKVKELIKKYRDLKNMDRIDRYKVLWGDIETEALEELKRRIIGKTESKLSERYLMEIVNRTFIPYEIEDEVEQEKEQNIEKPKRVLKTAKEEKKEPSKIQTDSLFTEEHEEEHEEELEDEENTEE